MTIHPVTWRKNHQKETDGKKIGAKVEKIKSAPYIEKILKERIEIPPTIYKCTGSLSIIGNLFSLDRSGFILELKKKNMTLCAQG